ncbi:hypothetical protein [Cognatishimia activa]|uniref:hypothetical protein n=1 Tax=Cognatishimia activa TaxID=1715691 RepID=UPI00222F148E|nr:hypothetical protein [Cognatishimia activa]UZD91158.1 hypothetical protein M0D42_00670 [Cognatishimia activa]
MQFLEWSVVGLRSAKYELVNVERGITITIFPMVHIAEQAFYDAVYTDAAEHDLVILEGIGSKVATRITRSYRWLKPEKLGMVVQPKFPKGNAQTILGDLPGEDFDAIWNEAPLRTRVLLELGAGVLGIWKRLTARRSSIGRKLNSNDLKDRDWIMSWNEEVAAVFSALSETRDMHLQKTIFEVLDDAEPIQSIAVIFGAAHMGPLVHCLSKNGFNVSSSDWLLAFSS